MKLKLLLVMNNVNWLSLDGKVKAIKDFFSPKFDLQIDVKNTFFSNIPFSMTKGSSGVSGKETVIDTEMVDPNWYDANITTKAIGYDFVLFYVDGKNTLGHLVSAGIRGDADQYPIELTLFGINETDNAYQNGVCLGNCFYVFACHEISHGVYMMLNIPDNTHKYFYSIDPAQVLKDYNFITISFVDWIKSRLQKLLDIQKTMDKSKKLYDMSVSLLDKHLTLNPNIDKSVGCAQAMSYILKQLGYPIPVDGISGTVGMYDWLKKYCTEIDSPLAGDIIISVTGTGNGTVRGHVGVVGNHRIMSNSSYDGLWSQDWTLASWKLHFTDDGGIPVHYFRV